MFSKKTTDLQTIETRTAEQQLTDIAKQIEKMVEKASSQEARRALLDVQSAALLAIGRQ